MNTASGRAYRLDPRETVLADYYRLELLACGCPVTATERVAEYAARLDALHQRRRIVVDNRDATVLQDWTDHETGESGVDYRFDGESTVHWIRNSNVRLGRKPLPATGEA
jgi:hypothetical protein